MVVIAESPPSPLPEGTAVDRPCGCTQPKPGPPVRGVFARPGRLAQGLLADGKGRGATAVVLPLDEETKSRWPEIADSVGRAGMTLWPRVEMARNPGLAYGRTDDLGYEAVEDPMHVHELHATMLHLLGLDHQSPTYRYAGRDMRLTDVKGVVHTAILA
jgi:hypothetical protein